jgi:hypothetical protein
MKSYAAVVCLLAALGTGAASAETALPQSTAAASSPVAFVYVSSFPTGTANVINAYTAAADGSLSPVSGSPFNDNVLSMAVNGKYLFGANRAGVYVAAFLIQSNGSLKWTTSTDVDRYNPSGCVVPGDLIFDHTGASLYFAGTAGGECQSTFYESFKVESSDGYLQFLGNTPVTFLYNTPLSFSGNNLYAYGSNCINYQGNWLDNFTTYKRESNGLLTATAIDAPLPAPPHSGDIYCRTLTAADPTNHFAMALQPIDPSTSMQDGPEQLATYTIGSSGALSTTSTSQNMPSTAIEPISVLSMAPSGKLLAAGGINGLQIFSFNGASPMKAYKQLLSGVDIEHAYWDNANHLYALSENRHSLYVFTVTTTTATQAPGSPHNITGPLNMIVQPRN